MNNQDGPEITGWEICQVMFRYLHLNGWNVCYLYGSVSLDISRVRNLVLNVEYPFVLMIHLNCPLLNA